MPPRRQGVTIKHVAADAGVSLQTVSRVINNEPNVRPEMARRVQDSIDRLGYVPLIAAQRMGGSRSRLILALNDRDRTIAGWQNRQGTDWVDQMLLGGMLTCGAHGYRLILELVDTHSDHIERELSAAIGALQPDGVILTPPHSQDPLILDLLARRGISIARIGSRVSGPGFSLTMGDEGAAQMVTEHLVALGHRRIGFIEGAPDYELSGWRVTAWRTAMAAAGLSDDLIQPGDFDYESGYAAAVALLDVADPPTAIIASSDQMAMATLALAKERGLAVPDDLSIVSFDDTPIVRFAQPPLTAVTQPIAEVAARAVERIIAEQRDTLPPAGPVSVAATLNLRASTAPPRSTPR
ncbi:LacI family DNA-binding transcriptional regulator [Sphingomonas hankookensis]|uniref:LacI family transcriptional regulator n=1 Tax=Sphingomonas hengshuiensis TaxID=1609977 RepID=A0A2W4ZFP9_9SPHN|nr:MAG: LacI family transcriptional regulator [Sphingomonas hengshuiensis]